MTESQIAVRPYSLLRTFSLLSLLTIVAISAISATLLSRFLTRTLLQRDAVLTMEFVQSIAEAENATAYFDAKGHGSNTAPLDRLFDQIAHMPDVVLAHVYARDTTIVWSKYPELVGTRHRDNAMLKRALSGELMLETSDTEDTQKPEHKLLPPDIGDFVENYIPVRDYDGGAVVGVVEVYKVPNVLFETISRANRLVWASAIGAGLFLYAALFWIVRRASAVIRHQQAALVDSERMAVVGEMTTAVAHGVRNPLASIRSSAEVALDDAEGPVRTSLYDIVGEVDRLESWVRDLLTCNCRAVSNEDLLSVEDVIRGCLEGFRARIERQGIRLDLEIDEPLPKVRGNGKLLGQAINCLISNALEAMPKGGRLSVSTRCNRSTIYVRVRDSGVGISADKLAEVGQPFVTSKPNGLGVGLSLCERILRRFGGTIKLSSFVGLGTTVRLTLPAES
ncbi:MAG: sensor histidine kinase [Alphaproteobacteria bacterium]